MAQTENGDALIVQLQDTIAHHIQEAVEGAVEKAMTDIELEVRKKLGNIALSLLKNYSVQYVGQEIVIKIKNEVK